MSYNIPFEIQLEIIKKVADVKSLIQCRAVSKLWKSFIDSPEFIIARDTHPRRLLLRYTDNSDEEVKYVSFVDDEQQEEDIPPNVPNLIKLHKYSKVIGSSCGLWCLLDYFRFFFREMVVIWNPSIRKSVGIVVPYLLTKKMTYFGFGVCPSTYDPTVVVMYFQKMWQVGIFTLSSKAWKMIPSTANVPRESIKLRPNAQVVATDRFIFWDAYDWLDDVLFDDVSKYKPLILSFDLITQEFKELNLPDSIPNRDSMDISISKLNESLVVSVYTNEVNGLVYGVWMMGEDESFTKLFNINTPENSSVSSVLGFTISGEPIMETVKEYEKFAASKFINHAQNTSIISGFMEKRIHSSFALTRKHCFLLTSRAVVLFPTIIWEKMMASRLLNRK